MAINVIEILIIFLIGLSFPIMFLSKREYPYQKVLWALITFHFLFGIVFFFYTNNGGGDAYYYWSKSKEMEGKEFWLYLFKEKGTYFIFALNFIPANILAMNFFTNTLFYTLIGNLGLVYFYLVTIRTIPNNYRVSGLMLFPLIFFMPNLHFWSSGVGKDTISFCCVGMFSYGMLSIGKRSPLIILSLVLAYLIRPHVVLFLVVSFALAFLVDSKIKPGKKVFLSLLLIAISIIILPAVFKFANIESASVGAISSRGEQQTELLRGSETGSSVNISSYPLPLKVFTFLYRPLFFDINGVPALFASIENLLLLVFSFFVFKNRLIATFKAAPFVIKGLVFFLIIGSVAFAISLGNLGIMIRMRNMLLPGFLMFILWSFSYQQQRKRLAKKNLSTKLKTI
jgi:hypothetical protein